MKYFLFLMFFSSCLIVFSQGNQPTNSVTITPNANTTDVKGNIKASGLVEGGSLRVNSLATGNQFAANPIYADVSGNLITGYKIGFYSIPHAAFQQSFSVFGETNAVQPFIIFYSEDLLVPFVLGQYFAIIAPLQVPHKSKLENIKIGFSFGSNTPKSLRVRIRKSSFDGTSSAIIADFNTITSVNYQIVVSNASLNLIEIDNQNYYYSLIIFPTTDWELLNLRGVSIEYRDM
ncbi:hypothetical protein [Lacihabitans lacunae]|uniref:Uncharacterized protein n=1 Tax=Lacihabitans lacunae TaxID=1028214 RepID=A0ABV7YVE2_9BACT